MHRKGGTRSVRSDEIGYFAVAVAGDVLDGAGAVGTLVETAQRYDGEHLVDGPAIGQRLEQGEVAEVFVGEHL